MESVTLVDRYQLQHQISSKSGRKTYRAIDLQTQMLVMVFEKGLEWAINSDRLHHEQEFADGK
jgi:hypothetical protein